MVHLCLNDCFQIYLIPTYMTIGKTETKLSIDGIFNSSFILKSISNFTHFDIRTVRPKISDETNPDLTPQKMLYERVSHSHWSIRVNPLLFYSRNKSSHRKSSNFQLLGKLDKTKFHLFCKSFTNFGWRDNFKSNWVPFTQPTTCLAPNFFL